MSRVGVCLKRTLFLSLCLSTSVLATVPYPKNCSQKGFYYKKNLLYLTSKQKIQARQYFFYNISNSTILINHPVKDPGASAGWASQLNPKHYSLFFVNANKFTLNCGLLSKNDYFTMSSCKKVLRVCQVSMKKNSYHDIGSGWVKENKVLTDNHNDDNV